MTINPNRQQAKLAKKYGSAQIERCTGGWRVRIQSATSDTWAHLLHAIEHAKHRLGRRKMI